ncbi:immunoglobulin-like domain-containing protein [Paenibacillus sp. GCM10012307]
MTGQTVWDQITFSAPVLNNDLETVEADLPFVTLGDTSYVTKNLVLPAAGRFGSTITWESSDTAIAPDGTVTRPVFPAENKLVTLTAHVTKGSATLTKTFSALVITSTDKPSAPYLLYVSKNYYDVVKNKVLGSFWDYGAVLGGWGSLEGYKVSDYTGNLTASTPTEYAGLILGLLSTGNNPYQTPSGQNLVDTFVSRMQGSGGSFSSIENQQIWAIIALNAANAEQIYNGANPVRPYDKKGAVKKLIGMQTVSGSIGDLDLTGMALIALSGSRDISDADVDVNAAIAKAVAYLKANQLQTGTFAAGWGNDNGNTHATVLSGLAAAGEDVTSSKWAVNGKTPIDTLAQYYGEHGGFMYQTSQGTVNDMATYQSVIALGDIVASDSVWKRIKLKLTDEQIVTRDKEALALGNLSSITTNITLPVTGAYGSTITWKSSNTTVISETGIVARPAAQDTEVTLTATVRKGSAESTKAFTAYVKAIGVEPVTAVKVNIRIEGPEGRIAQGSVNAATPGQALDALAMDRGLNVSKKIERGMPVLTIEGIHSAYYGEQDYGFWDYAVRRENSWITSPDGTMDQIALKASDEVIIYYNNHSTMPIDSIAIIPQSGSAIYDDIGLNIVVHKMEMDFPRFELSPVPANDITVTIYNDSGVEVSREKTDAKGEAAFNKLPAGDYTVSVSDYVPNSAPTIIHTTAAFQVWERLQSVELATLSVIGDSEKGTIIASKNVELLPGDTAFTILARELGNKINYSGEGSTLYVKGIDGLSEFDRGPQSGWMYAVNGVFPQVSAGLYTLQKDDVVAWRYTLNQGVDLGANQPDTDKPVIHITGITDQTEYFEPHLTFSVTVTDNKTDGILPEVKLNGALISKTGDSYVVELQPGVNTITVRAEDESGNVSEQSVTVIYKVGEPLTFKQQLDKNLAYLERTVIHPTFGTLGGEWSILSLARANYKVAEGYYQTYYSNAAAEIKRLNDLNNGLLDPSKSTEHSRAIIGLTAIGKDPGNVNGYDLTQALSDYGYVIKQGINGPIFALIALDSRHYSIPVAASGKVQTTRGKLIDYLLNAEVKKGTARAGGWALSENATHADIDITSMVIQALAPYYQSREDIRAAADRAVNLLAAAQNSDGSFSNSGISSSESMAQVVTALSAIGVDAKNDARFIKNGMSALDALLSFALADGGFMHIRPSIGAGIADAMATDQGTYALVAYDRFKSASNRLYDMTDVSGELPDKTVVEMPLPSGDQPKLVIPSGYQDIKIPISADDANKEVKVEISSDMRSKVMVSLPVGTSLPKIEASKGNIELVIPKGIKITSGDASSVELITTRDATDTVLRNKVSSLIPGGKKLDSVDQAITVGGDGSILFDGFVTLTFAGMKGKEVAYIQNGYRHIRSRSIRAKRKAERAASSNSVTIAAMI